MRRYVRHFIELLFCMPLLCSCFTGVEGTKRVEMSRGDVQASLPTEADKLVACLTGTPFELWTPGMQFTALDDRASLIFDSRTLPPDPLTLHLQGKTLRYTGTKTKVTEGLDTIRMAILADSNRNYIYEIRQPLATSTDLPMFVDMALVNRFDSLLRGRKVWITNPYWQTSDSTSIQGLKFAPVDIIEVTAGLGAFPVRIHFQADGQKAWVPVSLPQSGPASRRFAKQFSLTDPRLRYPTVSDETWALIQRQQLAIGMTKTEVRLSLGEPSDVSQGHNSALIYELWQYPDGSYLMFVDGLLQRYKVAHQPSKSQPATP